MASRTLARKPLNELLETCSQFVILRSERLRSLSQRRLPGLPRSTPETSVKGRGLQGLTQGFHLVTQAGFGLTQPRKRCSDGRDTGCGSRTETIVRARKSRKKFQCPSFKYDSTFLTCLSRAHSPPSGTGFSAYKAFPAPAATCPRLAASPSRGFYRPAARGRMQTFTAPRAPPAGEIVRLVHICTRDLYAFVRETLTLSSLR